MLVIGIAGGTGSGKTTIVERILEEFSKGDVSILPQDSYYRDTSELSYEERCAINFDHPKSIDFDLMVRHLEQLRGGEAIEQPVYSFETHNRMEQTISVSPSKIIILEGILIFTNPRLRELCDLKIYVHADSDQRLIRRLKRDIGERGRDLEEVLERYQKTLKPMHEEFIEPTMKYADIIIPTYRHSPVALDVVRALIRERTR